MTNSLQAVLDRTKSEQVPVEKPKIERVKSRKNTVLIGGHFSPEVLKQLRIIAAEEGTTNQALLEQALNLLFTKKGKSLIEEAKE